MIGRRAALVGATLLALGSCTGDDGANPPTTTATTAAGGELASLLIAAVDLPPGFAPETDVDDTITTFCAGQDATAGLQASERAIAGFARTPAGASVIELVFRFEDDGADRFVEQADELLTDCSDVPDATGLAFTYEPVTADVAEALDGTDASTSRYGTSVGAGNLTVEVAVVKYGDLGMLIAVLGLDQPRAALDALATEAFKAATTSLQA